MKSLDESRLKVQEFQLEQSELLVVPTLLISIFNHVFNYRSRCTLRPSLLLSL